MRLIIFLFFIYSFTAFSPPEKHYAAFQKWYVVNQNQLESSEEQAGLTFQARYLPTELVVCEQVLTDHDVSKKEIKALYETYDAYEEYCFKIISPDNGDFLVSQSEDKADYQNKQFYLIESVQQDFFLIRNSDTLMPLSCQFENNYGTAPFVTLHLTFQKAPKKQRVTSRQLIYRDQLFTGQTIQFDFSHLSNLQIPKIK